MKSSAMKFRENGWEQLPDNDVLWGKGPYLLELDNRGNVGVPPATFKYTDVRCPEGVILLANELKRLEIKQHE